MELLWNSLEEWLNILRTEIDEKNDGDGSSESSISKTFSPTKFLGASLLLPPSEDLYGAVGGASTSNAPQEKEEPSPKPTENIALRTDKATGSDATIETLVDTLEESVHGLSLGAEIPLRPESLQTGGTSVDFDQSPQSPGESVRRVTNERLSWGCGSNGDNDDVISAIAPRICAVIQAFYMCCACQNQQK